jgi:two-component system, NtrC family, sensor histidine kinase HydH
MAFNFEESSHKPKRFQLSGKVIASITLVLVVVLIASSFFDIIGAKRELSHVLTQQAESLIAALEAGGTNAIESYNLVQSLTAERLLGIARLLEQLDSDNLLSNAFLAKTAQENNVFRINIFNVSGNKELASFYGSGQSALQNAPDDLMKAIKRKENDELVMGFRNSQFSQGQRFAIAKRRRKGGVIVLNVDAQEMLDFRRSIGLGKLFQDIGGTKNIQYISIQDSAQIIVATANIDSLSTMHSDPFLSQPLITGTSATRFIEYNGEQIFEIVQSIKSNDGSIIRLGVQTQHIKEAERAAILRAVLSSLFLLLFGGIVSSLVISGQNYKVLQTSYSRIETYTGSILKNMTDAVIAVNNQGIITLVNEAAENLLDIEAHHICGKLCTAELTSMCPFLKEALNSGKNSIYSNEKIVSPRGTRITNINVNAVKGKNNEIFAVFAVIKDVTEQKRLEGNLSRKDRITAMGHLASGVAHEIRNPLNAIGIISQRLKAEFKPTSDNDEYKQLTSTVVSETRRINDIIQRFLQFTRPADLNKQLVNISELLQESALLLESQAIASDITVIRNCENVPDTSADADKLKQVFLNIGQNAIAACSAGDKIEISCRQTNKAIIIEFSDSGHGISKINLDKIFNLYYTTRESGSGIGLSVVQQIISQHDGLIEAKSSENEGSTFSISLPISG